jgi:hypothetical protein
MLKKLCIVMLLLACCGSAVNALVAEQNFQFSGICSQKAGGWPDSIFTGSVWFAGRKTHKRRGGAW